MAWVGAYIPCFCLGWWRRAQSSVAKIHCIVWWCRFKGGHHNLIAGVRWQGCSTAALPQCALVAWVTRGFMVFAEYASEWLRYSKKKVSYSFMFCGVVPSHSFSATTPTTFPGRNLPTLSNTQLRKLNSGTKTTFPACFVFLCRFTTGLNVLTEIRRNPSRFINHFLDSGLKSSIQASKVARTIF